MLENISTSTGSGKAIQLMLALLIASIWIPGHGRQVNPYLAIRASPHPLSFYISNHFERYSDFQAFFQSVAKAVSVGSLEGTWSTDCTCASCTGWARTYDGFSPTSSKPHKRRLTELQLLLCPPRVLGFALWQKTWVQLLVDNVAPLKTEGTDTAFKLLELAPKTKELIKSLVQQHTKNNGKVSDLIPGKGNGLIVLLHGPPGVGKTLTAESVAMLTGKPLYSISMSDIGLSSAVAETNLIRIFDLAGEYMNIHVDSVHC